MEKLNPKQSRFVLEYVVDLNATQAAIRAGYAAGSADVTGSRLLEDARISQAVKEAVEARAKRTLVTADYVVTRLKDVAEKCMQLRPVVNGKGEQLAGPDGQPCWTFDSRGANRALELLGKHLGIFTERVEVAGCLNMELLEEARRRVSNGR